MERQSLPQCPGSSSSLPSDYRPGYVKFPILFLEIVNDIIFTHLTSNSGQVPDWKLSSLNQTLQSTENQTALSDQKNTAQLPVFLLSLKGLALIGIAVKEANL